MYVGPGSEGDVAAAELGLPVLTGLPRLDDIVQQLGVRACRTPPTFGRLVAYVGESIIAARGGGWQMRQAADSTTWEPRPVRPRLQGAGRVGPGSLALRRGGRPPRPGVADRALTTVQVERRTARAATVRAVDEAIRVLRPGGQLLVADFWPMARKYATHIGQGTLRPLGPGYWYGGPWAVRVLVPGNDPSSAERAAAQIAIPLLVVHGGKDRLVLATTPNASLTRPWPNSCCTPTATTA